MRQSDEPEDSQDYPEIHNAFPLAEGTRELLEELKELFPVPDEAADAYLDNLPALAERVDNHVLQRPDISDIIGSCPVDVITTNHRNHGRFMGTVCALDLPSLLIRVIPWAYRVYSTRGVSYDYFPAELKGWRNALEAELDPAHARPIRLIYRWMIDRHETMMRLSEDADSFPPAQGDLSDELEPLLSCLLRGDSQGAQSLADESMLEATHLPDFYVKRIQPVMYRIGNMWATGEVTVAQEHVATALVSRIMAGAYRRFDFFGNSRGHALVACATDEFHELGARTVADLLELSGWDVTFVGADVPERDFQQMALDNPPEIVALSATIPSHLLRMKRMVNAIRTESTLQNTRIMVGGLALSMAPEAVDRLDADGCAGDGQDACRLAEKWWKEDM